MQLNGKPSPVIPFADQYIGAWAILEEHANALLQQAQNINIQLHLEQAEQPEAKAAIAAQASTELNVTRDGVCVIELSGSLTKHASSMSSGRSMVAARRQVRAAAGDPDVQAILLHIDSPGGTVAGTIDLGDDVAAAAKKKPVHAYIEDLGASGAYWIASQATRVFANRGARVGSIGAFAVVPDFSVMAEKNGVKVNVIKFGAMKGAGIEGTAITEEQLAHWQKSIDGFGNQFVEAVAAGRGMPLAQAQQLADGRVHDAVTAVDLKLIDGVQTLEATMAGLVAAGKKPPITRTKAMSASETDAPKVATHKELKAAMPEASAEFILGQLEANATVSDALKAYNTHLAAELKTATEGKAEAEKKAADAEAKATAAGKGGAAAPAKVRGNKFPTATASSDDAGDAEPVDYRAMAKDVAEKRKCTYREACMIVKRQHPESRDAFKGEPLKA